MEVIPERGDIWWVALDPTLGSEIRKTRPLCCHFGESAQRKTTDGHRYPAVKFAASQSPDLDPDLLR